MLTNSIWCRSFKRCAKGTIFATAAAKGSVGGSADKTWTVADLTNVSGDDLRGEEVQVDVYLKNSTAAQTVDIEAVSWAPSRTAIA